MKTLPGLRFWLTAFAALQLSVCHAADDPAQATGADQAQLPPVSVIGKPLNREEHHYKDMLKAMDMFKAYQQSHPDAYLRFRIFPRIEQVNMGRLKVSIVSDTRRVPVEMAPDGSFTLPVLADMIEQDANVQANWPDGDLGWTVQVKRENKPAQTRVLGDLREECKLDAYGANLKRRFLTPGGLALKEITNICLIESMRFGVFAERPIFSVHLREGNKVGVLLSDRLYDYAGIGAAVSPLLDGNFIRDRRYFPPLYDNTWSDDAELEIEYMEDKPASSEASL